MVVKRCETPKRIVLQDYKKLICMKKRKATILKTTPRFDMPFIPVTSVLIFSVLDS